MHLRCELCGGPENWCLDRDGEVWVRCMDESCLAHQQIDFWPEDPIWPDRVAPGVRGPETDGLVHEPDPSETLAAIRAVDPSF